MPEPTLEALILAGGKGTRLRPLTYDIPKPMVPVAGRPFLEFVMDELVRQGCSHCVLSIGYLGRQIVAHFGEQYRGMPVTYVNEPEPLGTGGGIANCLPALRERHFLVLNGDTYFQLDLREFLRTHLERGAEISLGLKAMRDFDRYGTVEIDPEGRLLAFREKEPKAEGQINAGVYAIDRKVFGRFGLEGAFSFEDDLMRDHVSELQAFGQVSDGYFIDIGIPEDFQRAQGELPGRLPG